MPSPICPKCSRAMEEGFLLDNGYARFTQAEWVEGKPKLTGWWPGLRLKGKARRPVTTYCCPQCGFLESYASLTTQK
jgi:hypothetical protein